MGSRAWTRPGVRGEGRVDLSSTWLISSNIFGFVLVVLRIYDSDRTNHINLARETERLFAYQFRGKTHTYEPIRLYPMRPSHNRAFIMHLRHLSDPILSIAHLVDRSFTHQ